MKRDLQGWWAWAVRVVAIAFAAFQLYTAGFGFLPDMQQRAVHVAFATVLTFALFSLRKRGKAETKVPILDLVLMALIVTPCINAFFKYKWFAMHFGETPTTDLVFGIFLTILIIEAGRRTSGWVFPGLTIFMLLYALLGQYFPGEFRHPGQHPVFIIHNLYQSWRGIWGFITGASATIIAIFIIFGVLIKATGAGETFIDLSNKVAGRMRGGPALVSVIASGLFGTISGSAAANVATTGNFTIPLMKRLGYKPEFAAGVEATASSGGQLAPPIMGIGAFIMAELLQISYLKVVVAAVIPAYLFYLAVFTGVRFEALRLNLPPVPREQIVPAREIFTWSRLAPLVIPVAVLFIALVQGFSITRCGFFAIVTLFIIYLFSNFSPRDMKERLRRIVTGLQEGAITLLPIVSLCVCANIVIALINQTGLGMKLSGFIISAAGASLPLALLLSAVICLVLGMGLPTAGAYILTVTIVGPALVKLGLMPLQAHLFVFYFAVLSAITPPVCLAAFTGAAIAQAPWFGVAKVALRLGLVAYFMPFIFTYDPAFIMVGSPGQIVLAVASASLGAIMLGATMMGYLNTKLAILTRVILMPSAIMLFIPGWQTDLIGFGLIIVALLYNKTRKR